MMDFDDKCHEYYDHGKVYQSVNEWLSQFKTPFAKEAVAKMVAKKRGLTPEQVIEEWELNASIAINYGNAIHKGIEYWIKTGQRSGLDHILKATNAFSDKYDRSNLFSEMIVKNDDLLLAGTMDVMVKEGKREVGIVDIKTNADLDKKAYGKFKEPFQDLPQTNINEYRLQLSTYKHLCELQGLKVNYIRLEHWDGNKFTEIELKPIDLTQCLTKTSS
jgi:hypothetical protein